MPFEIKTGEKGEVKQYDTAEEAVEALGQVGALGMINSELRARARALLQREALTDARKEKKRKAARALEICVQEGRDLGPVSVVRSPDPLDVDGNL